VETRELIQTHLIPLIMLRPHPRNPRTISPARLDQLKRVLKADPEMLDVRPIIALPTGTVIAGNQRLAAATALRDEGDDRFQAIPCAYVDLDEDRAVEWAIRDNEGFGENDTEQLASLLEELADRGRDLDLTGLAADSINQLLKRKPGKVDPDDAPDAPDDPRSQPGEVYELGDHRLLCGDATDPAALELLAGGEQPGMLWTDPPYGVEYVGKTADALTIRNDGAEGLPALLDGAFAACATVLAPSARFYIAAPAGPRETDFRLALDRAGWRLHQALVWVKDVFVLGHSDHHYRHETILYGYLPGDGRPGRGSHKGTGWYGDNRQDTVFEIPRPKRSTEHPTMKPVDLIAAHLANSTQPGGWVLDPFAGSGSTMVACEQSRRRALLVEIDPAYCDVIRQRYADFTGHVEAAP
jgi:DNA modification methylase